MADMQLLPSVPRVSDFYDYGAFAQHVLIATQFPLRDTVSGVQQCAYLLDLRPSGITWGFTNGRSIKAQTLVDRFNHMCPASHYVSISGARPRHEDEGLFFDLEPGQVLTVDYRLLPDSSSEGGSDSADSDGNDDQARHGVLEPADLTVATSEDSQFEPASNSDCGDSGRSRSPPCSPQRHSCVAMGPAALGYPPCPGSRGGATECRVWSRDMWTSSHKLHSPCAGSSAFTSALLLIVGYFVSILFAGVGLHAAFAILGHYFGQGLLCILYYLMRFCRPSRQDIPSLALVLLCAWSFCPGANAVRIPCAPADQLACHSSSCGLVEVWRHLPTPCRAEVKSAARSTQPWILNAVMDSDTEDELEVDVRGNNARPHASHARLLDDLDADLREGRGPATLLRQSAALPTCSAFAVAAATLEVLFEEFLPGFPPSRPSATVASGSTMSDEPLPVAAQIGTQDNGPAPGSSPRRSSDDGTVHCLCLEGVVPVTSYQQDCLDLRQIVPVPVAAGALSADADWLDNDMHMLCQDSYVPVQLRRQFLHVPLWHRCDLALDAVEGLHIYTDGSASSDPNDVTPCSWAFAVWCKVGAQLYLYGFAAASAVPADTPFHVGECRDDSTQAELLALVWALVWTVQFGTALHHVVTFHFDATSVGYGVFGEQRAVGCPSGGTCPSLADTACYLRQYASRLLAVHHAHVPGHRGILPNELVDQLAKKARRCVESYWDRCLPGWPAQLVLHRLFPWLWMLAQSRHDLPTLFALESEAARLQGVFSVPAHGPRMGVKTVQIQPGVTHYDFSVISYNVLTLKDKRVGARLPQATLGETCGMRIVGRRAVLLAELERYRPLMVGLQETRLQDSAVLPDQDYFMLHSSATDAGVGGCALWVSKHRPYATHGGEPQFLQLSHLVVTGQSHRHLCVFVDAPHLRLFVMVLHGPSSANHPPSEVMVFWKERLQDLQKRPPGSDYLLLADANARLGEVATEAVGPHQQEPENPAGSVFHDFLLRAGAMLPATFSDFHEGLGETWFQPQGVAHRIDYVVVPSSWRSFDMRTAVLTGFEALQLKEDHSPVWLWSRFARRASSGAYSASSRRAVRPPVARDSAQRLQQEDLLSALVTAPWHCSVDHQYESFVAQWTKAGLALSESQSRAPKQPFLTEATVELVDTCRALRAYLRDELQERRHRLMMICFAALRLLVTHATFSTQAVRRADRWLTVMDYSESRAAALLRYFNVRARRAVHHDRIHYLQGLVSVVGKCELRDSQAFYRAVRKAFPTARSSRRSAFVPLPAIVLASGEYAVTPADKAEAWRAHFGAQEAGVPVDEEGYLAAYRQCQRPSVPFDLAALPSLAELEQAVLQTNRAKAPGPDGITGDLLRLRPVQTAKQLFPIILKTTLSLCEPVEFRGGLLHCLAKKAGAALLCTQFRSIMLSSTPGKLYHRLLRNRLVPLLETHGHPTQAGTVPGIGIESISLVARTFQAQRHNRGGLWGLLFYDLQSAFYRVVREALFASERTDAALRELVHKLGLPPCAMAELVRQLNNVAILPAYGASPHLEALIHDMLQATWFRVDMSDWITLTHRGTRPGDPAADVLFSLVFAAFVRMLEPILDSHGLTPTFAASDDLPPWASRPDNASIGFPSWADDFVSPVEAPEPTPLLGRVRAVGTIVLERATSLGMCLTFASDKTAALLPSGHNWLLHGATYHRGQLGLWLHDSLGQEDHFLPFVDAYKHLGHILTSSTSPQPDILFRRKRAQSVIKPLRSRLFGNRNLPLATRRTVLQSLAASRFVHSSAAVILPAAIHERMWDRAYLDIWRVLIPRTAADMQAHSLEVLRAAQAPTPPLAMALSRARFLSKLTTQGPTVLRYVLFQHWQQHKRSSWLAQVEADLALVLQYLPDLAPLFAVREPVLALLDALWDEPGWWLRAVRRAIAVLRKDLDAWSQAKTAVVPADADTTGTADSVPAAEERTVGPFQCHLCPSGFRLRKHLGAHLARTHRIWSPSRHYTLDVYCHACHRWYGSAAQVGQHLKHSDACLLRMCHLFPPLTNDEIAQVEGAEKAKSRLLRSGDWTVYEGVRQRATFFGPFTPTAEERLGGVDFYSEDLTVLGLRAIFHPKPSDVNWISDHIAGRSVEGKRATACSYWRSRSQHCFTVH